MHQSNASKKHGKEKKTQLEKPLQHKLHIQFWHRVGKVH